MNTNNLRITTGFNSAGPVNVQGNVTVYINSREEGESSSVIKSDIPVEAPFLKNTDSAPASGSATTLLSKTIGWSTSTKIDGFPPRNDHAAVGVGKIIYSFGGLNPTGHLSYSKFGPIDVYVLNTDDSELKWKCLEFEKSAFRPNQRRGHTAVVHKNFIFIFGGQDTKKDEFSNSTYRFNSQTFKWDKPQVSGTIPDARLYHSSVVVESQMIVCGGFRNILANHLHSLDLESFHWSIIKTNGIPPSLRFGHSATVYKDRFILIFGGYDREIGVVNSIFCFCMENKEWIHPTTKGTTPQSRSSHSAFMNNGRMYIFGGWDKMKSNLNDLFLYNPETLEWKEVIPIGEAPSSHYCAGCVSVNNRVYMFVGEDGEGSRNYREATCVLEI